MSRFSVNLSWRMNYATSPVCYWGRAEKKEEDSYIKGFTLAKLYCAAPCVAHSLGQSCCHPAASDPAAQTALCSQGLLSFGQPLLLLNHKHNVFW